MNDIKQYELWVGGEHKKPSTTDYFDDLNPQDDSVIAKIASGTTDDVNKAVAKGREAFKENRSRLAPSHPSMYLC